MKRSLVLSAAIVLFAMPAARADEPVEIAGHAALALAGVVAQYQPRLSREDRAVMTALLDGATGAARTAQTIGISATSIDCRASNVAIAAHSCELAFGEAKRALKGRAAHELFATLIEAGAPADGAAGSVHEAARRLTCTIRPAVVAQNGGGGATCRFTPGG